MLIGSYKLLLSDPGSFVRLMTMVCAAVIIAVTVHEYSHALIARMLGDRTAQHSKRLTLNPLRHSFNSFIHFLGRNTSEGFKKIYCTPRILRTGKYR